LWRSLLVLLVLLLAAGGATAYVYLTRPPPPPPPPPTYAVPDVAGDTVPAAVAAVAHDHLALAVGARQWSATVAKGAVISQYPVPGTRLLAHKVVAVTVSRGPQPVAVPSLATLDMAQARAFLEATGLHLGKVTRHTSMTIPSGIVISWSDHGHRLLPGSAVNIVVSAGKPMATIPASADGMTFSRLDAELVALRFPVTEYRYYSNTVPAGEVISTDPTSGSTEVVGTPVAVNVSLGPHLVTIPSSLVGLSDGEAAKVLARIGLYVSRVAGSPLEPVQGTEPAVGTQVLYGSSIVIVTSG
jgi:serine/threonine-protein kinase